jgi:hypothetical protein
MTEHKTITIKQPHVAAIFAGLKRFETRSWPTKYRGPLLIHAGKAVDFSVIRNGVRNGAPFAAIDTGTNDSALARRFRELTENESLGLGCILGAVDLVACRPAGAIKWTDHLGWGDFTLGRFAWELAKPRLFKTPIPVRGQLGLWTYRGEIEGP